MDDAFDTFRNQRIWAVDASTSRFPGHYICPLCRTEVTLASGLIICNHFRHLRGTDHEECERYSKNFGREVPLSQHEYEHLDAVLVANQTPKGDHRYVSFAVRFRPTNSAGRLKLTGHIDFVSGQRSTAYTIHSSLRQQFFRITAPEKSYLIKAATSDGGSAQYPVEGFEDKPALFRSTDVEAVRIAKHRTLKPGGYIVVSRKPISGLHPSLETQALLTFPGLHAKLIQIPEKPNWEVRRNVKSLLHFEISANIATYGFLAPARAYELAPDCWEVSRDSELAIFIRLSRAGGPKFNRLLVQHRLSGQLATDYLALSDDKNEFVIKFKPSLWRPDLFRIGLATSAASPVMFLLEINYSDDALFPQCARMQFQFSSALNEKKRLKWSAQELPEMLIDAARGVGTLNSITNKPEVVKLTVSDSLGQRVMLPEVATAENLLSFLQRARFPCILSASGYPDILLRREKRATQQFRHVNEAPIAVPRCRWQARLLDAYNRRHVSKYSIRSLTQ